MALRCKTRVDTITCRKVPDRHYTWQRRWRQLVFDRRCKFAQPSRMASSRRSRRLEVRSPQDWGRAVCKGCCLDLVSWSQASQVAWARTWCFGKEGWVSSHALLPCSAPSALPGLPEQKIEMNYCMYYVLCMLPLSEIHVSSPAPLNSFRRHQTVPFLALLSWKWDILKCKMCPVCHKWRQEWFRNQVQFVIYSHADSLPLHMSHRAHMNWQERL